MSLVVDFVLLGGTNSLLVIWGLTLYSLFRHILPLKTVNAFCTASFTPRYKFSYRALARQSRLSVIPYQEVNFDWFPRNPQHYDKVIRCNSGFYASDIRNLRHQKISCSVAQWSRSRLHVQINPALFFFDIVIFFSVNFYFLILFFPFACFPLFLLLTLNSIVRFLR